MSWTIDPAGWEAVLNVAFSISHDLSIVRFLASLCVCSGKTEEVVVIDDDPDPLTRSGPFRLLLCVPCICIYTRDIYI